MSRSSTDKPTFSIILPTYNHGRLIKNAIESILGQTRQDFEVFIVCDGAVQEGIDIAHEQARKDVRFHVREHPKGSGHGETYRDQAIREANGSIVCYLSDDDFWLPNHLEVMEAALEDSDLAYSVLLRIAQDGYFNLGLDNPSERLDNPKFREKARINRNLNRVAQLSAAAHRMSSYLSLPQGWTARQKKVTSYADMWFKFIEQDEMRIQPVIQVTSVVLPSNLRNTGKYAPKRRIESRSIEVKKWMSLLRPEYLRGALDQLCQLEVQPFQLDLDLKHVNDKYIERHGGKGTLRVNGHIKDAARRFKKNNPSLSNEFQYRVSVLRMLLQGIR